MSSLELGSFIHTEQMFPELLLCPGTMLDTRARAEWTWCLSQRTTSQPGTLLECQMSERVPFSSLPSFLKMAVQSLTFILQVAQVQDGGQEL